jgi:hypothetical protein
VKRNPKGAKQRRRTMQVWTYDQAQAAASYLTSVVRSLREHGLEALARLREVQQITRRPGRPDRTALIAQQEAERQAAQAEDRFREAAEELQALDIYSLDPIQGQALVPFVHNDQLAWYVFDLFDPLPFRFWRYQSDPDNTRRPITPGQKDTTRTV